MMVSYDVISDYSRKDGKPLVINDYLNKDGWLGRNQCLYFKESS